MAGRVGSHNSISSEMGGGTRVMRLAPAVYLLPFTKVMEGMWGDGDPRLQRYHLLSPRGKTDKETERREHSLLRVCLPPERAWEPLGKNNSAKS